MKRYWKLKEGTIYRSLWRGRFGRGSGFVVWETRKNYYYYYYYLFQWRCMLKVDSKKLFGKNLRGVLNKISRLWSLGTIAQNRVFSLPSPFFGY
jgi:hypothetical protein